MKLERSEQNVKEYMEKQRHELAKKQEKRRLQQEDIKKK